MKFEIRYVQLIYINIAHFWKLPLKLENRFSTLSFDFKPSKIKI